MNSSIRMLVLDDNVDVAESLGEILELSGYAVTLAHDGMTAIDLYCRGDIDVGLFDVKMPGVNGVDALLAIKARVPEAAILLMSGYADDGLIAKGLESGAIGLLSKPFEADDMLSAIARIKKPALASA